MRTKTLGCGLLIFALLFGAASWLCSAVTMFGYSMRQMGDYTDPNYLQYRDATVQQEVWSRIAIPGLFRSQCYSAEIAICKAADSALHASGNQDDTNTDFLVVLGGSSLVALIIARIFYLMARPSRQLRLAQTSKVDET